MAMLPFNIRIGLIIRTLRQMRGMTQAELGKRLNVSFQQVQKYENGKNGISAERLQQLARVLEVPVAKFYTADFTSLPRNKKIPAYDIEIAHRFGLIRDIRARRAVGTIIRHLSEGKK